MDFSVAVLVLHLLLEHRVEVVVFDSVGYCWVAHRLRISACGGGGAIFGDSGVIGGGGGVGGRGWRAGGIRCGILRIYCVLVAIKL